MISRRVRSTLWPTRLGGKAILFYLLLLVTFFAIPYANLYFLGLAFLSVIAAGNVLWAHANVRHVRASVAEIAPSPAGHPIPVRFVVDSGGRASFLLSGTLVVGDAICRTAPADVGKGGGVLLGELPALPRGVYEVTRASVESPYPHGLVRAGRPASAPRELVVHPAPLGAQNDPRRARAEADASGSSARADDRGVAALRDWRPGDEPRRVHWRASARRGQLVVRETETDEPGGVDVVLDRRCAPAALEHALSQITTLALAAGQTKDCIVLRTQGLVATYGPTAGTGAMSGSDLLRALATMTTLPYDAGAPPVAPSGALRLPWTGRR